MSLRNEHITVDTGDYEVHGVFEFDEGDPGDYWTPPTSAEVYLVGGSVLFDAADGTQVSMLVEEILERAKTDPFFAKMVSDIETYVYAHSQELLPDMSDYALEDYRELRNTL